MPGHSSLISAMPERSPLFRLHADVDARVGAIRHTRPDWPCSKGCDTCCRRLADVPRLTAAEWGLLLEGLRTLPPQRLQAVRDEVGLLGHGASAPIVCPMLDRESGACPVYAYRPVACRTYGFYVQRELGLYCSDIEARVAQGELDDVVWGNQDVIDQALSASGETRSLTEWFALTF